MKDRSRSRKLGTSILIGLVAGTVPLSGCEIIGAPWAQVERSPEEQRLFQAAITQNDPTVVERYLRRYPQGQILSVLNAQRPEVLMRLAPGAFNDVSNETLRQLPESVVRNLPPKVAQRILLLRSGRNADERSEDSYSG